MDNLTARIIELSSGVYVIPGNTNVGVIINESPSGAEVYLVDSGCTDIDGEYVLEVLKAFFELQERKFTVKAILLTHGHPDHCGAANFIKQQTNCKISSLKTEQGPMETPLIQTVSLWGSYPPHEMRTLFFMPQPTCVDSFISQENVIQLSDERIISFMPLSGHSFGSVCIIVTDKKGHNTLFPGDNIFPRNEIMEHWVPLISNPVDFMDSLDKLCSIKNVDWCIPSHGDFLKRNIEEAAELNKIAILSTRMCILEVLKSKKRLTTEDIVKYVADKNEFKMGLSQFALVHSTVKSYLSVMHDAREIVMEVADNKLYFSLPPATKSKD